MLHRTSLLLGMELMWCCVAEGYAAAAATLKVKEAFQVGVYGLLLCDMLQVST
jgi:hypothetical protein